LDVAKFCQTFSNFDKSPAWHFAPISENEIGTKKDLHFSKASQVILNWSTGSKPYSSCHKRSDKWNYTNNKNFAVIQELQSTTRILHRLNARLKNPMPTVTRFQVMAVLQAARAQVLGLDLKESKSWGLNRALFYAAAKRAWANTKAFGSNRPFIAEFEESRRHHDPVYVLGGERAYRSRDLKHGIRFKFGSQIQTPEDFDDKIKNRLPDWKSAWSEAKSIIRSSSRRDLDIQSRFFKNIYEPQRDMLARKWSNLPPPKEARAA